MVNDNTDGDGGKSGASLQETKGGFVKKVSLPKVRGSTIGWTQKNCK